MIRRPAAGPSYDVPFRDFDDLPGRAADLWPGIRPLEIGHYLWLRNGYTPRVEVRLFHSAKYLHVRFEVAEKKVRVRYMRFQDPVWKDTCVEFFVDAFPAKKRGYLNFETNAAGTLLAAFGPDRHSRDPLWPEDLAGFEIATSVPGPMDADLDAEGWWLEYRLPLAVFRKFYGEAPGPGHRAAANFYKCGDETASPHYGAWSPVETAEPDFHRPEFFGTLVFLGR